MLNDEMNGMLQSTGFSVDDDPEVQRRLKIFALLVIQHRGQELTAMFEQWAKAELRACADQCRKAGHDAAADMLITRADALLLDADGLMMNNIKNM